MPLGPVMLDIAGVELSAEDRELLQHPAVGGVILFARNYDQPEQLEQLTRSIREVREPGLLVAVDQEGGRVQRFRDGFQRLPPATVFGELYQQSPQAACQAVQQAAWLMASELQSVGVDYSFAPVLDIDRGICSAIGDRAFSADPEVVSILSKAWLQGTQQAGMAAVGKHFPGHGGVEADSHLALPRDERSLSQLQAEDLQPFRDLIQAGLQAVMPAHVVYPAVDTLPAGFSSQWLQIILRHELGFQGVIISDALDMAAAEVAGSFVERSIAALHAGCDQLLVCNNREAAVQVVEALADYHNPQAEARLQTLYSRTRQFSWRDFLRQHVGWDEARALMEQLLAAEKADLEYDPTTRGGLVV